jgi:short-subunit dehydrogenase
MTASTVILVTGASSGIGEATARLFAQNGYRVVLAARRFERLQILADEIQAEGGLALPVHVDLADLNAIQSMVKTTLDTWGQVDILLNNAGLGRLDWLDQLEPMDDIHAQVVVNLLGAIQTTRALLPHMIERRQGHVINMGSIASLVASPTYSIYAATKFGLRGFTEALRREVGVFGIKVSGIYPGGVRTEFDQHAKIKRKTGYTTPRRLKLESDDVARAVMELVKHPRRQVILPKAWLLSIWVNQLFPGFADRLIEKRFTRPERISDLPQV